MLFQSSEEAPVFHVKHWIRQSWGLCVSSPLLQWLLSLALYCVSVSLYARHGLNFHYMSITSCVCACRRGPAPQLSRGPSVQFAIVCHHLLALTNKMLAPRSPPVWPQHTWDQLLLSFQGSVSVRSLFLSIILLLRLGANTVLKQLPI